MATQNPLTRVKGGGDVGRVRKRNMWGEGMLIITEMNNEEDVVVIPSFIYQRHSRTLSLAPVAHFT